MGQFATISFTLTGVLLLNICGYCEMSVYAGLRRRPPPPSVNLQETLQQNLEQQYEMPSDYLAQLMEENARRRLQQQFEQQLALINRQMIRQRQQQRQRQRQQQRERYLQLQEMEERENDQEEDYDNSNNNNNNNQYDQYDDQNADFSFKYATNELTGNEINERIPFAVGPADPRFYEEESHDDTNLNSQALDEYEEYVPAESKPIGSQVTVQTEGSATVGNMAEPARATVLAPAPVETSKLADSLTTTTFHRIKPQTAAAAAVAANVGAGVAPMKPVHNDAEAVANTRHDISALIEKLQKEGKSGAILNSHNPSIGHDSHVVVRQHLGMEGEMGVYVVALIAGVSAAITVGLIALGVAWYTLRNKTKLAADVEYPAYGVTGPNKDISPSGDRKLAQSAQMYHYQHQKQQIIAMENRQAAEGNCGLSDVESDDDNEEGDYTVYECPGLAPTGEMEVKNPLFLDETPVTPAAANASGNNVTQATQQQQPQQAMRKDTGKASTSMAMSSEEKNKKKNTK